MEDPTSGLTCIVLVLIKCVGAADRMILQLAAGVYRRHKYANR